MKKKTYKIESEFLKKNVDVAVYGHYGCAILLFPAAGDDYLEYEKNGFIEAVEEPLTKGKYSIFSIESVNGESWLNDEIPPEEKSQKHSDFNDFIVKEALPFLFGVCGGPTPIMSAGASIGAYHAANEFFRRPDLFIGTIAISGTFNIQSFTGDYFDKNCYFNSPEHYLPNLDDKYWLSFLKSSKRIFLVSGSGEGESPDNVRKISEILKDKEIHSNSEIRGEDWGHNWSAWNSIFKDILTSKL